MTDQEKLLTLLETVATNDKERWIFREDGFMYTRIGIACRVYDWDNNELHFDDRENACKDVYRKLDLIKRVGKAFNQSYGVAVAKKIKGDDCTCYYQRDVYNDYVINGESLREDDPIELNPDEEFIELEISATMIDDDKAQKIKSLVDMGVAAVKEIAAKDVVTRLSLFPR